MIQISEVICHKRWGFVNLLNEAVKFKLQYIDIKRRKIVMDTVNIIVFIKKEKKNTSSEYVCKKKKRGEKINAVQITLFSVDTRWYLCEFASYFIDNYSSKSEDNASS